MRTHRITSRPATLAAAILGLCAAAVLPAAHAAAAQGADTAAVRQLFARFNDAVNSHVAQSVAAFFTADADFIVIGGEDIHGTAGIVQHLTPLYAGPLKNFHRDASVTEVRFVRPDVALLVGEFTSSGVVSPAGATLPPSKGVYDWVLVKRGGHWMISLWHEANLPVPPARRG